MIPTLETDEVHNSRNLVKYNRLAKVIHFTSGHPFEIAMNLSMHGSIWTAKGAKVVGGKERMYAFVDHSINFKGNRHILSLFGEYKPARPHNAMTFYTLRTIWLVRKDFFTNIFAVGLTSLVESGIYGWWDKRIETMQLVSHVLFREMNDTRVLKLIPGDAEATTIEQTRVAFDLHLDMMLVTLLIFIREKLKIKVNIEWSL